MTTDRPNVLIIQSDQHNASVMGCAGDLASQTPNLDNLASEGCLLTNLYCHGPICAPSRMSFFTGVLPTQSGVLTNEDVVSCSLPTFAHSAAAVGYHPHLIGKTHATGADQTRGFASRDVGDHTPNYPGGPRADWGGLPGTAEPGTNSLEFVGMGRSFHRVRDEYAAEAACSFLRKTAIEQQATGNTEKFFLMVGLSLPHQPYVAPREDYMKFSGRVPPPRKSSPSDHHPFYSWWRERNGVAKPVPAAIAEKARTAYWAMVSRLDEIVGRILGVLAETGLKEDTLVIYTSDHGDLLGEHGLWWKHTLLDPAVKVPGIVSWPGMVPSGIRCDAVAGHADINATMLDAMSAPPLPRSDGKSLLDTFGGARDWRNTCVAEYAIPDLVPSEVDEAQKRKWWVQRMVRWNDWKYIDHGDGVPPEMFNVKEDPGERVDLVDEESLKETRHALRQMARDGWNPVRVAEEAEVRAKEVDIFANWARTVKPEEVHRWAVKPEYNAMEEEPSHLRPTGV